MAELDLVDDTQVSGLDDEGVSLGSPDVGTWVGRRPPPPPTLTIHPTLPIRFVARAPDTECLVFQGLTSTRALFCCLISLGMSPGGVGKMDSDEGCGWGGTGERAQSVLVPGRPLLC